MNDVRWLGGALALVAACSFESGGSAGAGLPGSGSEPSTGSGDSADTSGSSTGAAMTGGASMSTQPAPDDDDGSGPPPPESTTSGEPPESETSQSESGADGETTTGPDIDCSVPVVLSVSASEGELFPPMSLQDYAGATVASSGSLNAGAIRFSFDVECPSNYRLFGRVRDDDPGVHNCCDPDSFDVEGPGGVDIEWFYGCDTFQAGLTWVPVEVGVFGGTCDDPEPLLVPLTAGTYAFTLRNRESDYFGAVAGIAELVLTNDPDWEP